MKANPAIVNNIATSIILFTLVFFISACTAPDKNQSFIQFSNPLYAAKSHTLSRDLNNALFDSLEISIENTQLINISKVKISNAEQTVKLSVPANTSLIVNAQGLVDGEPIYVGEVTVNPITPGQTTGIKIMLYDQTQIADPISVDIPLNQSGVSGKSLGLSFSRDNSYVLFSSKDDTNQSSDLYLRDLSSDTIKNLHTNEFGDTAELSSSADEADISADGVFAVFSSSASNLVPGDTNNAKDIFLKNTITGEIQRISIHQQTDSPGDSYNPQISDDGNIVSFYSDATIIGNVSKSIFIYRRLTGDLTPLSIPDLSDKYRLSGDGKVIVYQAKNKGGLKITNIPDSNPEIPFLSEAVVINQVQTISSANIDFNFTIDQTGLRTVFIPSESANGLSKNQHYLYNSNTRQISLLSKTRTNELFSEPLTQNNLPALSNDGRYIAFSYNDETWVKSIEYNNLLKLGAGRNPIVSVNGDKIGYEIEGRLYVVDNPLYLASQTPAQKAQAPANFRLEKLTGRIKLLWDENPDAAYYRVYLDFQAGIANSLNDPQFLPVIFETSDTILEVDLANFSEGDFTPTLYFIVFAVNESGEGAASVEISSAENNNQPPSPAFLKVSSILDTDDLLASDQELILEFSKPVDTATIDSAVSILDSSNNNIPLELSYTNTSATIYLLGQFSPQEVYTVNVDTSLKTMSGEALTDPYTATFMVSDFVSEGTIDSPVKVLDPPYLGSVDNSKSYYSIDIPVPESNNSNQSYILYLKNQFAPVSIMANSAQNIQINCDTTFCVIDQIMEAASVNIIVDGTNSITGTSFELMLSEVAIVDIADAKSASFEVNNFNPNALVLIKSTNQNGMFHLTDITSGANAIADFTIRQALTFKPDCIISLGDGEFNQCDLFTEDSGAMLLEFTPRFNRSIALRNIQLDIMPSIAFDATTDTNFVIATDDKFAHFYNLTPGKAYYLSLTATKGSLGYQVSQSANFLSYTDDVICDATLDVTSNDLDSCAFTANINGSITLKLAPDVVNNIAPQAIIQLFELEPALKRFTTNPATFTVEQRLAFIELDALTPSEWYGITLTPTSGTSFSPPLGELKTYFDGWRRPACNESLQASIISCEVRGTPDGKALLALEFTTNTLENATSIELETKPITTQNMQTISYGLEPQYLEITPVRYMQADSIPFNPPLDIIIEAQFPDNIATPPPLTIKAYPIEWQGTQYCQSITLGNTTLCLLKRRNSFYFKIYDNLRADIPIAERSSVYLSVTDIAATELLLDTPLTLQSNIGDYKIYRFNGLSRNLSYRILVSNVGDTYPAFRVFNANNLKDIVCLSASIGASNERQCDISNVTDGYVVLDTSKLNGRTYDIFLTSAEAAP